jgi:hypothetical protein
LASALLSLHTLLAWAELAGAELVADPELIEPIPMTPPGLLWPLPGVVIGRSTRR